MTKSFPIYKQLDAMDCGPTCLRMVAKYYGRSVPLDYLRNKSEYGKEGVSMLGLSDAAESIGFKTVGAKLTYNQLINEVPLPAILHWDQYHFVVLYKVSNLSFLQNKSKTKVYIADPAKGLMTFTEKEFKEHWISTMEISQPYDIGRSSLSDNMKEGKVVELDSGNTKGIALLLESTPLFKKNNFSSEPEKQKSTIGR